MASHIENKAIQLREEAVKKLSPVGFFKSLFGGANKTEEAIEYYVRAGNLFKMARNWLQAGLAFSDAADLNCKSEDYMEAAMNYSEAANCFKRCDTPKAVEFYLKAIKYFSELGKIMASAKMHQTVAELMEEESNLTAAAHYYEEAAELFTTENHPSMANKCLQKVAEFAAIEGMYQKAIKLFQKMACFDLSSSLLKYSAKEYLFRATICYLCSDPDIVESVVNRYVEMYPAFKDSRECHLIRCLLVCIDQKDLDGYANAIRTYDAASKLSMWHVTMLLRAKKSIESESIR